jgi:predicted O-methyltransferase YrrM
MTTKLDAHALADWVQSMGHAEIDWLKVQAATLPPDPIVVNIGAAAGVSTLSILEARPDALIYSCEIDPGAGEYSSIERAGLDKSRVIRLGESSRAGYDFESEVDFIFVDGGHEADQVMRDIDAWLPHLKPQGVIAFHDYHSTALFGVKEGVDDVMGEYPIIADVDTIRAYRNGRAVD